MSDVQNPFESPPPFDPESEPSRDVTPVGQAPRVATFIIDSFITCFLSYMAGFVTGIVVFVAGGEEFYVQIIKSAFGQAILLLVTVSAALGYYIVLESATQQTIGKLLIGTKVVDENGKRPRFGQIVGRSFARLIPFEPFSFLSTPCRGWHDSLSNTYVVKTR